MVRERPRFPPNARPVPSSRKLLHERCKLHAIHQYDLWKVRLQNGSVLAELVVACLSCFFLAMVFLKDLSVLFLYGFQLAPSFGMFTRSLSISSISYLL